MDKNIINKSQNKHTRIVWPDILKCFAIFLVILGHIIATYDSRGYNAPVNRWIYSFHMPLFMMLSGLFFKYSLSKKFMTLLASKSIQLLVPLFTWSLVGLLIEQLMLTNFNDWGGYILDYLKSGGPLRGFWYLKCLFIFIIVNYGLIRLIRNEYVTAVISISLFIILPNINFTRMMIPFFWLGYFYEKIELKLHHRYTLAISGITMLLCYYFLDISRTYLSNPTDILSYIEFLAIGGFASLFWISFFRIIFGNTEHMGISTLRNIGGLSLGIYCSHELLYFEKGWKDIYGILPEDTWYVYVICSIIILVITYLAVSFFDRVKITRLLLLGKKS